MPSFSIPLSGLNSFNQALSVIANNLANLNTVAFKGQRTTFRDLFYQQIASSGSGNPVQVGVGSTISSISSLFTQGSIESSGVSTDVAIQGDGFFVLERDGLRRFSRAGNFSLSPDGSLITDDGSQVLGFPAAAGVVNAGQTLTGLQIATGQTSPPNPTSFARLSLNLNAESPATTVFSTALAVNDSLGASHLLTFTFTKTGANAWDYEITIPAADVGASGAPVVVDNGSLAFDGAGQLTTPAADVTGITVAGFANGANDLSFDWRLFDTLSGAGFLTQLAAPSAVSSTRQDGFSAGNLLSFTIQGDGIIQGIFSNGQTTPLGQIALATFANPQGLLKDGANNFLASLASGAANIGAPNNGGRGTLAGGALELSNVDIAREFAQLIVVQRGFQANARAITTFDEVTQEAINLKR